MSMVYRNTKGETLSNDEIDSNFRSVDWRYGGDLASAGTLNFTDEFNYFHITGTTGVTAFGDKAYSDSKYGYVVMLEFDGAVVITHNAAALALPSSADITTAAGDIAIFVQETAAIWRLVNYMDASASVASSQSHIFTFYASSGASGDIGDGATEYFPIVGNGSQSTTEADVSCLIPHDMTLDKLYIEALANDCDGSCVFTPMISGVEDTSLQVTLATTVLTGNDTTGTISVTAGETVSVRAVAGGTTGSIDQVRIALHATA